MTVQQDLQKAIAAAKAAQGTYAQFAEATADQALKQAFQGMEKDMVRHLMQLNHRLGIVRENLR
jgi:rubrerythrin